MNLLIVEDELLVADYLKEIVLRNGHEVGGMADTIKEAIQLLAQMNFDVVFLDIRLSGNDNGIELGKILSERGIPFIYISANTDLETLREATDTKPFTYLSKPFHDFDIIAALTMIKDHLLKQKSESSIWVKSLNRNFAIPISEIFYIKADNVYIEIHTRSKVYTERITLKAIEEKINSHIFMRVHRSYLVNKNYVENWTASSVKVSGSEIPMSKKYFSQFLKSMS